ncbi:hypothetical protein [Streptomyces megasporus]|uniref:hypothetical protein n=1 Tax=Streptomyces megasporus TaxID=44060 RepID=UPI0004E288D1
MEKSAPEQRRSLAIGQRSLGDPRIHYPLWPPVLGGCPRTSSGFKDVTTGTGAGEAAIRARFG